MSGTTGSPQEKKPQDEIENWNLDRTVTPYTSVRGMMKKISGDWTYWDGLVGLANSSDERINPATSADIIDIGVASAENSSTTPLGISGVFTGTAVDTTGFVTFNVVIYSNVASATDGFCIDWSPDGTNWDLTECHTVSANTGIAHLSRCKAKYARVRYTNGGTAQTTFRLATILKRNAVSATYEQLSADVDDSHDAALVRAIIAWKKPNGDYTNFQSTTAGNFKISLEEIETGVNISKETGGNLESLVAAKETISGGFKSIDIPHARIHLSQHYTASDAATVNATTKNYLVITPDTTTRCHFTYSIEGDGKATIVFNETGTVSANGTQITAYNNDRNSANAATLLVYKDPTVTGAGTTIENDLLGSGKKTGGENRNEEEFILKQNTKYLLRLTTTANVDVVVDFHWYEV